ncbi:CLUMA_CG013313, isoform A, partial [Clunio marinus]
IVVNNFGFALLSSTNSTEDKDDASKCEKLTVPLCKGVEYNMTIFPNLLNHTNQGEAALEVEQFFPLIKVGCSGDLKLFLCLLYAPVCTILEYPIPPCGSLCESAKKCENVMKRFGFMWPKSLECSKFPQKNETLCLGSNVSISLVCSQPSSVLISTQQQSKERYSQEIIENHNKCEPITIPLCLSIQYNKTIFPNLLGHTRQDEAALEVHQFIPLIKIECSPDLKLFLCSLYAPLCTILEYPIPPCRSLCESARNCEKIMKTFDFMWPESLECSKFPEDATEKLCISNNASSRNDQNSFTAPFSVLHKQDRKNNQQEVYKSNATGYSHRSVGFVCPVQLKAPPVMGYELNVAGKVVKDCGAPCNSLFFDENERTTLRYWISSWAALCVASCLFTILTFIIDSSRFRYPERPIVFLAICYLIVGMAYVSGLGAGDTVACREPFQPNTRLGRLQMISTITQGHRQSTSCTVLFMMLYFCSMAAFAWWTCLALAWLLASGFKWGHEAIEARSHLFHLIAWAIPAIQTISVLALGKVEGDVLSGVCFVGQLDRHSLAVFLIIPLCIYLSLGTLFLFAGFVSLFRIRTVMKNDGTKTDKLERLMMRIGFFSTLFILPSFVYLGCLFYEYKNFDKWMIQFNRSMCKKFSIPCPPPLSITEDEKPIFIKFMLKYVCSMLVGITSSVWLCSGKTVASWKLFIERMKGSDTRERNYV